MSPQAPGLPVSSGSPPEPSRAALTDRRDPRENGSALGRPIASVVIPAHNEAAIIERGLTSLLSSAQPGEFEIVVVCNGCSDDTAARARRVSDGITVVETPIASKTHALNIGDGHVTAFPRFYVDADIEVTAPALREVAALLQDDSSTVVAAPRAVVAYEQHPFAVRAFYRVWTRLPYFTENMVGSGLYAFSRAGRARFDQFPTITADDEFARLTAAPHERRATTGITFTIHPPRTLRGVVNIMTRARLGMYEFQAKFPTLAAHNNTDAKRTLRVIAATPSLWRDAPIYLGVMFVAKLRAHLKVLRGAAPSWERDDTSRGVPASASASAR